MKNRITLLNTLSSLLLQIVLLFSGFIIPKLILDTFGSETNGLISSLTQFLGYISLVEGGITSVITAALYKPLTKHDDHGISSIISVAKKFYRRIGVIFIIYAIILSVVYPVAFNTGFSFSYVASLTLILSVFLIIQYMMALSYKTLLNADKKIYVVSFTQSIIKILEIIIAFLSVKIYPDIHVLKFLTGIIFILQPIIFTRYVKKHYKIDSKAVGDDSLIKGRWDGFAINTAAFIHNCTDIAVLTIFTDLATVSVYSVYALITNGIKNIISSLVSSLNPTLGHEYAKGDFAELNKKLDMYEYIIFITVFLLYGVAGLLITPFVCIYTNGLIDADYYQPLFGILIIISEALYLLKLPHLNLAYSANKFKDISKPAFIEAGLNIVISVALVPFLGLIGVAIGTIIAMLYRLIFHVYYTSKIIPGRRQWIFYSKLLTFIVSTCIGILVCLFLPESDGSIVSWIWHAVVYTAIIGMVLLLNSGLFFRKELKELKKYIRKK